MSATGSGLPAPSRADRAGVAARPAAQPADAPDRWLRRAMQGSGLVTLARAEAVDAALCAGGLNGQQAPGAMLARGGAMIEERRC